MNAATRNAATGKPRFVILPDLGAVAVEAADRFVESARAAIEARGAFRVALSGGTTPNAVYPLLRSEPRVSRVDWSRVEFFWGDERAVPPDDPESNFGTAYRMFISKLPHVRPEAVHRMQGEGPDLDASALSYETELRLAPMGEQTADVGLALGVVARAPHRVVEGLLDVDEHEGGAVGGEHGVDCMLGPSGERQARDVPVQALGAEDARADG